VPKPDATRPADALPDPQAFDPVLFPGQAPGEEWPPPRFDFQAAWMHRLPIRFERDEGGTICLVHAFEHLRLLADIGCAHAALDVAAGSRDHRLIRLVPAALRFVPAVAPGDAVPGLLRGEPPPPATDAQAHAASMALVAVVAARAGEAGEALRDAMARLPPSQDMFERAVATCVGGGIPLDSIAPLAKRLQRLANAHARLMAAEAALPDFAGLERVVAETRRVLARDRRFAGDLLPYALAGLEPAVSRPREAVEGLLRAGRRALDSAVSGGDLQALTLSQETLREALLDLGTFWQRTCAAWLSVDPETTDRRDIEALARNAIRRLRLDGLYRVPG
jgi:hypothetical protein